MDKETALKIGLALNRIAVTVCEEDYEKIKSSLKEIEDICSKLVQEEDV